MTEYEFVFPWFPSALFKKKKKYWNIMFIHKYYNIWLNPSLFLFSTVEVMLNLYLPVFLVQKQTFNKHSTSTATVNNINNKQLVPFIRPEKTHRERRGLKNIRRRTRSCSDPRPQGFSVLLKGTWAGWMIANIKAKGFHTH